MIEILGTPFMQSGRAHGIATWRLLFRHALPAAANSSHFFSPVGRGLAQRFAPGGSDTGGPGLGPLLAGVLHVQGPLRRDWDCDVRRLCS